VRECYGTPGHYNKMEKKFNIPHLPAHEAFARLRESFPLHFLLESKQVSLFSGRFSLIGLDPVLKISGKKEEAKIELLQPRGLSYFNKLLEQDFSFVDKIKKTERTITVEVKKQEGSFEESSRPTMKNISQVIRLLLTTFGMKEKTLLGLYGAMSYDFIRLFEDLHDRLPENEVNDFTFFLYDTFIFFDHIKEKSEVIVYRESEKESKEVVELVTVLLKKPLPEKKEFQISQHHLALDQQAFEDLVRIGKKNITEGEFVQVVFSNRLEAAYSGDPYTLYLNYREKNPSPYLFYFEFGDGEELVGASPEMMVRCEEGRVHLRPIAGTARRGSDPIEDHDLMVELLTNPKERAELEMLIDLGRSDLARICEPKIQIDDYRFVEKYSRVMHTVAHLSGKLRKRFCGLDALISCLNAGTLTGAPKVAAMRCIEQYEQQRRGYYGGTFGQLTFSSEVDTTIIIRTAHLKNGTLTYQSGAGIVYDSDPTKEYEETLNKMKAFTDTFSS